MCYLQHISKESFSAMLRVRRNSMGRTILPSSSTFLTIPVAFIFNSFLSALKDDNRRPLKPIPLNLFCAAIQHKLSFVYIILHLFGYVKTNFYFIFLIILKKFFVFCYLCYRQIFFRVIKYLIVDFKTGERGKK